MPSDPFNATLIDRRDVTPELAIVRIRPDSGQTPKFVPGQFCTLGLPPDPGPSASTLAAPERSGRVRLIRRAYSIASAPSIREYLELFLVKIQTGRLTPRLWTVELHGRLFLDEKIAGHFTLENIPADKDLVMVATGTGVAPFVSMLREYRGRNRWRRAVLVQGVRHAAELGYQEELERLAAADRSVRYFPTVTREPAAAPWPGLRGRVQKMLDDSTFRQLTGMPLDPEQCHVLLCGNPTMIKDVEALLTPRGFIAAGQDRPGNLHYERYW